MKKGDSVERSSHARLICLGFESVKPCIAMRSKKLQQADAEMSSVKFCRRFSPIRDGNPGGNKRGPEL
jgi:hypothetical protein